MHNLVYCYAQRRPISLQLADFGKKFPSTVFRSLSILLVLLIFSGFGDGVRGQGGNGKIQCGHLHKTHTASKNSSEKIFYDNFGNSYSKSDLSIPESGISMTCNLSSNPDFDVIVLPYIDQNGITRPTIAEQEVICGVLQQLADLLERPAGGAKPTIEFSFNPALNDDDFAGVGVAYFDPQCTMSENVAKAHFNAGSGAGYAGIVHGKVQINPFLNFYTEVDLNPAIGSNQYDLYSICLHEMLHVLGFGSRISANGSPFEGFYSTWDLLLEDETGKPLIKKGPGTADCCAIYSFNEQVAPVANLPIGIINCGEVFFDGGTSTSINGAYPLPLDDGKVMNILSHLNEDCASGQQFVMHHETEAGPNSIRRTISSAEVQILCKIGYNTAACDPGCILILGDDGPFDIGTPTNSSPTQLFTPINLFSNDFGINLTPNSVTFPAECRVDDGIAPISYDSNTGYFRTNMYSNQIPVAASICYQSEACDGRLCKRATVELTNNALISNTYGQGCSSCENLICNGDFEVYKPLEAKFHIQAGNEPNEQFILLSANVSETVDNAITPNGILGFFGYNETLHLPLHTPIPSGCTAHIELDASKRIPNSSLRIFGYNIPPCNTTMFDANNLLVYEDPLCSNFTKFFIREEALNNGITLLPPSPNLLFNQTFFGEPNYPYNIDYGLVHSSPNEPNWEHIEFDWENNTGVEFKYIALVIVGNEAQRLLMIDNLVVTSTCTPTVTVQEEVIAACIDGEARIRIRPCVQHPANQPISLTITADLPNILGVSFNNTTGDFTNGTVTTTIQPSSNCPDPTSPYFDLVLDIAGNFLPGQVIKIPLHYNASYGCFGSEDVDPVVNIELDVAPNANFSAEKDGCSKFKFTTGTFNQAVHLWSFGDGSTSNEADPVHMFSVTGMFTITHTVTTPCGTHTATQTVIVDCLPIACPCPGNQTTNFTIGESIQSDESISLLNIPQIIDNACIKISGTLNIDQDWTLTNCHLIFGDGAQIVVKANAKLSIAEGNLLEGCDVLWRGITVEASGQLFFEVSTIRDAEYAIQPKHGATIYVIGSTFDKNHIAIYTAPNTSTQNVTTLALKTNIFTCTGMLKPNYSGQGSTPGEYSYAMAEINKTVGVDFGKNNIAEGLVNGLLAYNSTFNMARCTIKNLRNGTAMQAIQRRGVHALSCTYAKVIQSVFEDNQCAIFAEKSNLQADLNIITNLPDNNDVYDIGIWARDYAGRQIRIRNNIVKLRGEGIVAENGGKSGGLRIKNNNVSIVSSIQAPVPTIGSVRGIRIEQVNQAYVFDNTVIKPNGTPIGIGIEGNNLVRAIFQSNIVRNFGKGYSASGGYSNNFRNNQVIKSQTGFEINGDSANDYCQNYSQDQTQDGWHFMGYCKNSNNFKCNNIGSSNIGLYLWGNGIDYTILGEQNNTGNKWNPGQYGAWGAFNAYGGGLPEPINDSRFTIHSSQIPTWSTGSGNSNLWFTPLLGTPFVCDATTCPLYIDNDPLPVGAQGEPGNDAVLDDLDIRIARGQVNHEGLGWVAQQHLYERLAGSPTLLSSGDANIQGFYASELQGTIGQLYQQRLAMNTAATPVAALLTTFQSNTENISTVLDNIEALRDQLEQTGQLAIWQPQIKERMSELATSSEALATAWGDFDLQRNDAGPALLASNAAIAPTNILADNEIQLNRILLQTDYFHFVTTNTTGTNTTAVANEEWVYQIKAIADQCPIEGGRSVYEARSWYHRFDPLVTWDDTGICGANRGIEQRNSAGVDQLLSYWVLPNPANDQIQILPAFSTPLQAKFSLFRFDGQLMQQINLNDSANMNLEHLPNGIYSYSISTEKGRVQSGKLIIQH